ncbi:MAG: hypothetical protein WKG07_19370 [Hymenobacter sp.]
MSHFVLQNSGSEDDAQDVYQEGVMVFYEKVRDGSLELSCQIKTYPLRRVPPPVARSASPAKAASACACSTTKSMAPT